MVRVIGTHGKIVNVQILGVGEVITRLRLEKVKIEGAADLGVIQAGAYVEGEVKESVMGHRVEPKSVDTGHFVQDVKFNKTGKAQGKVHAPNTPYAVYVEHSDRISGGPRHHFRNTEKRTKGEVKEIIERRIKLGKAL